MRNDYALERHVLRAAAIATLVLGVTLLFFTSHIIKLFDKSWGDEKHFAIYLGTALVGFAVTNWLYSRSYDLAAIRPALIGNLVSLAAASVIDTLSVISQAGSSIIWLILVMHLAFVGGFGYCLYAIRND